ncbi:MAG TPA: threonylcarbamoyl-AMP synthase [Desulfotomaculum sp.]|nr:threonylcarbamoyl-AMP synthase [Desulfotomaculum sp.]
MGDLALPLKTFYWKVNAQEPAEEVIKQAGEIIRQGGLVAFPTETVYGLGANVFDRKAIAKIFNAKGRPLDNPLIVHIAVLADIYQLSSSVSPLALCLAEVFWPGPLTLILPRLETVPAEVSAGLDTVAIRLPAHPVALALIRAADVPIAAPSANLSGCPSPTTAKHVWADLNGKIDAIIDGGPTEIGVESTVVDLTGAIPAILRPGKITPAEIEAVAGKVCLDPAAKGIITSFKTDTTSEKWRPRSPGMKYRHYAPRAPLYLIEGNVPQVTKYINELASRYQKAGLRVGIFTYKETAEHYRQGEVLVAGDRCEPASVAANLYRILRRFDELGVDLILAEGMPPVCVGLAVMNRLRRAAGNNIIRLGGNCWT